MGKGLKLHPDHPLAASAYQPQPGINRRNFWPAEILVNSDHVSIDRLLLVQELPGDGNFAPDQLSWSLPGRLLSTLL
jgi:hypothetical protein